MNELTRTPSSEAEWELLRPALDSIMLRLKESDRTVILNRLIRHIRRGVEPSQPEALRADLI